MDHNSEKKGTGVSKIIQRLESVGDSSGFLKRYTLRNRTKQDVCREGLSTSKEEKSVVSAQYPVVNNSFQDNLTINKGNNDEVSISRNEKTPPSNFSSVRRRSTKRREHLENELQVMREKSPPSNLSSGRRRSTKIREQLENELQVMREKSPPSNLSSVRRRITKKQEQLENELQVKNLSAGSSQLDNVGEQREWWEKERESFAHRVKSFISKMHLVQGERKFGQWKGSVMDSIGGAFLTQNVNDFGSSSAFMSLAARYPYQAGTEKVNTKNASCPSTSEVKNDKLLPINGTHNGKEQKTKGTRGANRGKSEKEKEKTEENPIRKRMKKDTETINWANLRILYSKDGRQEKNYQTTHAVDWEAVRMDEVDNISKAIEKRGMNNNLAARMKSCVNFLSKELGNVDLEWLRDVPPHKAKEYLWSIPGLGLKSVECIRLLTLQQKAFPIDTNAGRVAVRLGWVPLHPLPEGQEFHLLKAYPTLNSVQMYIWPRISELDVSLQYELHCHMITFAKVFCRKRDPNCRACPMIDECKHYASSVASRRQLALGGAQEKYEPGCSSRELSLPGAHQQYDTLSGNENVEYTMTKYQPKVEFSKSHSLDLGRPIERDIEDFGLDQVPRIMIDFEKLKKRMLNFIIEKNPKEREVRSSVIPTSEATPIPVPILKNKIHVRTEHQVHVLPDSHQILAEFPKREDNDSCPYLLAVWTPESLNKDEYTPEQQTVYGTILIPIRTALCGAFPLDGTYFQANEVFADDESSESPIKVPKESVWNLPRTTLYCGKSISALCRGMGTFEVQECFWRGMPYACMHKTLRVHQFITDERYVCFRGFDRKTREAKALSSKFHLSVSQPETTRSRRAKKTTAVENIEKEPHKKRGRLAKKTTAAENIEKEAPHKIGQPAKKTTATENIEKEAPKKRGPPAKKTKAAEIIENEAPKKRGRPAKKTMAKENTEKEAPKKRGRLVNKPTAAENIEKEAPKKRGRPAKKTLERIQQKRDS